MKLETVISLFYILFYCRNDANNNTTINLPTYILFKINRIYLKNIQLANCFTFKHFSCQNISCIRNYKNYFLLNTDLSTCLLNNSFFCVIFRFSWKSNYFLLLSLQHSRLFFAHTYKARKNKI